MYKLIDIKEANDMVHKLVATFKEVETEKFRVVRFGAYGYKDFTIYVKDDGLDVATRKKDAYLKRHRVNEDWTDPLKKGTLSRYILWNLPTLKASIKDYKKRFNL